MAIVVLHGLITSRGESSIKVDDMPAQAVRLADKLFDQLRAQPNPKSGTDWAANDQGN